MKNVIYLINLEDSDLYKIGITDINKIDQRVASLQTGAPKKLNIISLFRTDFATIIEKNLHKFFNEKRTNGEWFNLNDDDLSEFNVKCEQYNNNIKFLVENKNQFITKRIKNGNTI